MKKRQDIQGLRALAVISVLIFHAGLPLPGGFLGVDAFFAISGYVITSSTYFRIKNGNFSTIDFYRRRFWRLYPALAIVIACTLVASIFVQNPLGAQQKTGLTALAALLMVPNLVIAISTGNYFDASSASNPLLHTWSLGVEWQYYAIFPLVVLIISRYLRTGNRQSKLMLSILVLGLISLALAFIGDLEIYFGYGRTLLGYYSPVTRAWEFLAGSAAFFLAQKSRFIIAPAKLRLARVGCMALFIITTLVYESSAAPTTAWALLALIPIVISLIFSSTAPEESTGKVTRSLYAVGDASYSIYLWHWPLVCLVLILYPDQVIFAVIATLLALGLGVASYRAIEIRFLEKHSSAFPRKLGFRFGLISTLVIALIVSQNTIISWSAVTEKDLVSISKQYLSRTVDLTNCTYSGAGSPGSCHLNSSGSTGRVYVYGDSVASQYVPGLTAATKELGIELIVSTTVGCPYVQIPVVAPSTYAPRGRCKVFNDYLERTTEFIKESTIILAMSSQYWLGPEWHVNSERQDLISDQEQRMILFSTAIFKLVSRLKQNNNEVILVAPLPEFSGRSYWDLSSCSFHKLLSTRCFVSFDSSNYPDSEIRDKFVDNLRGIARVIDFESNLCPIKKCKNFDGENLIFKDAIHISDYSSLSLAKKWRSEIDRISK